MDLSVSFDMWEPEEMEGFIDEFQAEIEADVVAVLEEYGPQIVQHAQFLCPVRTGDLRASIGFVVDEAALELNVYGAIYYYLYVEFGTYKMAGVHMVEDAYAVYEPEIFDAIDNAIEATGRYF